MRRIEGVREPPGFYDSARRREAMLVERTERLLELFMLSVETGLSAEGQIGAALELGCRHLSCEAGYVARVEHNVVRYLHVAGNAQHQPGATELLQDSVHHFGRRLAPVPDFISAPLIASGLDYGDVWFVRDEPSHSGVTAADRDFVALIAAFIGAAVERSEQRRRAERLAFYDPLTGLPNRTLLADRLEQAMASCDRHPGQFAVHFYDLDGFKAVNDTHGHHRGDEVLCTIARRLEHVVRAEDTVARIGGDEFVVVQPGVLSAGDVERLSQRLRGAVAEPVAVGENVYELSASCGIAMFPRDSRDGEMLVALADQALYRVKQSGRDGIAFYGRYE